MVPSIDAVLRKRARQGLQARSETRKKPPGRFTRNEGILDACYGMSGMFSGVFFLARTFFFIKQVRAREYEYAREERHTHREEERGDAANPGDGRVSRLLPCGLSGPPGSLSSNGLYE